MVASYGEAKRQRFLRELAQLEEDVHLARSHAQGQLDKHAVQHMVGGPPVSMTGGTGRVG